MEFNIYNTSTLLEAVRLTKPVHTFLRDAFFPHNLDQTYPTETLIIDTKKGRRKMAPFVAGETGGITMSRDGRETSIISAPKIAPQRSLTIRDISARSLGENFISTKTPAMRQAELLGDDIREMNDMIDRREEWMIRELLFSGRVPVKGYIDLHNEIAVDQVISYGEKTVLKPEKLWNAASGSDIEGNLREWRREIIKNTGIAPTVAILGSKVVSALLNNKAFLEKLDIKNMNIGEINPVIENEATTYLGKLTSIGIHMYSYDEWYLDEDELDQPMVPEDKILLANRQTGMVKYAVVTQMEDGDLRSYEEKKVPKIWADNANDKKMVRLTSRPLPVPFDIESWIVAKVV